MCQVKRIKPKYSEDVELGCVHTQMEIWTHNSAVDEPKFMGRPAMTSHGENWFVRIISW